MLDPPVELWEQLDDLRKERRCKIDILNNHKLFLRKFQVFLERKFPLYDEIKDEIYVKVLHSFADSYYTTNINDFYESGSWTSRSTRNSFFKKFDELFSFAREASKNDMNSDVNLELLDLTLTIVNYSKRPDWMNSRLFELLRKAIYNLSKALDHNIPESKRLVLLEAGKEFGEASRLFVKGEESRADQKKDERRMLKLADLYLRTIYWTEQAATEKESNGPISIVNSIRLKVKNYIQAIEAFERGDEKLALTYEKQALKDY